LTMALHLPYAIAHQHLVFAVPSRGIVHALVAAGRIVGALLIGVTWTCYMNS